MLSDTEKRRLYQEAFEIMERAKFLLNEIIESNSRKEQDKEAA